MNPDKTVTIAFRVPAELNDKLVNLCALNDLKMSALCRILIETGLANLPRPSDA